MCTQSQTHVRLASVPTGTCSHTRTHPCAPGATRAHQASTRLRSPLWGPKGRRPLYPTAQASPALALAEWLWTAGQPHWLAWGPGPSGGGAMTTHWRR